jgi:DNA-binding SARP family transcriptional activator
MGLTKGEVGLIMWPDASSSELKLRFKNAIYRMRHAIGSDVVLFQDNIYMFNRTVDHDYDVQTFIGAIKIAREEKQDLKKVKALSRAVAVYKGEYLPSLDEEWVILDREKYKNMYIQAAEELAELYLKLDDVEKTIQAGQNALDEDPYYEPLHRIIMQAYAIRGDRASVSRQYEKCRKMLMDGIGLEPSEQTDQLFRDLIA